MKSKTLFRIGAALTALTMLGATSVFAAGDDLELKDDYTYTQPTETGGNELTVTFENPSDGDSTFLVWDADEIIKTLTTGQPLPSYSGTGSDILYVNQVSKTELINGTSFKMPLSAAAKTVCKAIVGMGGAGKTASLQLVTLNKAKVQLTYGSLTLPETAPAILIGTAPAAALTALKNANVLPTKISATYGDSGSLDVDLKADGWTAAAGDNNKIVLTATPVQPAATADSEYVLPEAKPTLEVTLTDTVNIVATSWASSVTAAVSVAQNDYATADDIIARLAERRKQSFTGDDLDVPNAGTASVSFTWAEDSSDDPQYADGGVPNTAYHFTATAATVTGTKDGVTYNLPEDLALPSVTVNVTNKEKVAIPQMAFDGKEGNLTLEVDNGTTKAAVIAQLPTKLAVVGVTFDEGDTVPEADLAITAANWVCTPEYDANNTEAATYEFTLNYELSVDGEHKLYETNNDTVLPKVTVTVKAAAPAFKVGDTNNDTYIDIDDLTPIVQYILSEGTVGPLAEPSFTLAGDTNNDTYVDIDDVTPIVQYILSEGTVGPLADAN